MKAGFRRSAALIVAAGLILWAWAGPVMAHGVNYTVLRLEPSLVCFHVDFSSGDPAAYAAVLIYGPGDTDVEYQNGRADRLGRFAFLPDRPGTWRVRVDAGMGHVISFEAAVPASDAPEPEQQAGLTGNALTRTEVLVRAALGVSLLINAAALLAWLRRRRS